MKFGSLSELFGLLGQDFTIWCYCHLLEQVQHSSQERGLTSLWLSRLFSSSFMCKVWKWDGFNRLVRSRHFFHLVCAFTRVLSSFLTLSSRSIRCFSSDTRMLSLQDTSHQISEEPETWSKHHLLLQSPLINSQRSFIRNWSWYLSNSEVSSALIETCVALSLWSFTIPSVWCLLHCVSVCSVCEFLFPILHTEIWSGGRKKAEYGFLSYFWCSFFIAKL